MWIDSLEKYLPPLLLPEWMWSPGATIAAVLIQTSARPEFRCPFLRLPASLKFGVQEMGAQCVSLGFGKTIFVGASAKSGWENCRTTTWETCKWRDRCIHVLLSAWRHYWKGFLNHRRGRDVFFSHQDTHENWRTTVAGTGTPWDMAEGLVYLPHFWNWLWGVMFTSFFQASLAYSNSN